MSDLPFELPPKLQAYQKWMLLTIEDAQNIVLDGPETDQADEVVGLRIEFTCLKGGKFKGTYSVAAGIFPCEPGSDSQECYAVDPRKEGLQ